ncbi:PREDICTED: uncharacterized protein LOC108752839 [Trachymyrmex septentrionalis]|uniref:uncharacterized protein LOC108752839 n=1 Tax=Trachymyrmex septentrionalis TaxID=34720 RepID=UPI00084F2864|nr:PREDICTED: uncharacterized protein LOC108752839 [Trachymyrmex septentrionalis]
MCIAPFRGISGGDLLNDTYDNTSSTTSCVIVELLDERSTQAVSERSRFLCSRTRHVSTQVGRVVSSERWNRFSDKSDSRSLEQCGLLVTPRLTEIGEAICGARSVEIVRAEGSEN